MQFSNFRRSKKMNKMLLNLLFLLAFATISLAQTSDDYKKGELFVGYSGMVVDIDSDEEKDPFNGVNVSGVYNFSKYVGVKGDFSTHHKSISETTGTTTIKIGASVQNFLGGVQIKNNSNEGRFKPFAHALAGVGRIKASARVLGTSLSEAQSGFSMAFGGGIDVRVNKRISIRLLQADFNPIWIDGEKSNNVRVGFGIVF
jgi:Outer membrane protein beta-barrel domain